MRFAKYLEREEVEFRNAIPTNTFIEAAATAGIKPIVCRQERVGVGIADGKPTRINSGKRIGVFTHEAGPVRRKRVLGITTAYSRLRSDLSIASRWPRAQHVAGISFFWSVQAYAPVMNGLKTSTSANQVPEIMRRAFSYLNGRLGPVFIQIP